MSAIYLYLSLVTVPLFLSWVDFFRSDRPDALICTVIHDFTVSWSVKVHDRASLAGTASVLRATILHRSSIWYLAHGARRSTILKQAYRVKRQLTEKCNRGKEKSNGCYPMPFASSRYSREQAKDERKSESAEA